MRESDALDNNPHVSRSALEAIHSQAYGWALSRCDFDHATAEDLMQQAYVELLSGKARFDNKSSLKTFVFSVVQNLARSRFRRLSSRLRLDIRPKQSRRRSKRASREPTTASGGR
jgi:RNA polymerase sigma-70 factor (ECF subfamily)